MAIGLWIVTDVSLVTVFAEVLSAVLLLALSFWLGRRVEAASASCSNEYTALRMSKLDDQEASVGFEKRSESTQPLTETTPALGADHRTMSALSVVSTQAVRMPQEFVNKALFLAWPIISEFILDELHEHLEPALQQSMPHVMGTVSLDESSHMGVVTPEINRMECIPQTIDSFAFGEVKIMRCIMNIAYSGDCRFSLTTDMTGHLLGKVKDMASQVLKTITNKASTQGEKLNVGVEDMVLNGECVVEFFHLMPAPPFVAGVQVYFANAPQIDFEIIGDMGKILHTPFIKHRMLLEVEKQFGERFVLPNRMCMQLKKDKMQSIWPLKTPLPFGTLRIAVLQVHGIKESLPVYVSLEFGCTTKHTSTQKGGKNMAWDRAQSTFDFVVSDEVTQGLRVAIYQEESSSLWGHWRGNCFGCGCIVMSRLLKQADDFKWTCWLNFSQVESADDSSHAGWPVLKHVSPEPDSGVCIQVELEFHPLCSDSARAKELYEGSFTGDLWGWKRVGHQRDVLCHLLIGIHSLHDLPFEDDPDRRFWVSVKKSGDNDKLEPTKEILTRKVRAAKHEGELQVRWVQPMHFKLHVPHLTTIIVEVKSKLKQKHQHMPGVSHFSPSKAKAAGDGDETLDTLTWKVAPLLLLDKLESNFDADLGGLGGCLKSCMMKAWVVGPKGSYSEHSSWSQR